MNTPDLIKLFKHLYIGDLDKRSRQQLLDSAEANQLLTDQWNHPENASVNQEEPDFDKLFKKITQSTQKKNWHVFFTVRKIAASLIILIALASMVYFYLQSTKAPLTIVINDTGNKKRSPCPMAPW